MTLGELIRSHLEGRHVADVHRLMVEAGSQISRQALSNLVNRPLTRFPQPDTLRALAVALGVPEETTVRAAAASLGLDVQGPAQASHMHQVWLGLTANRTPDEVESLLRAAEHITRQVDEYRRERESR